MKPNHGGSLLPFASLVLAATSMLVAGCSGGTPTTMPTPSQTPTGASFVVGTDAPAAGVTSFTVVLDSVTATDSNGNTVPLISGSPAVDFARYNGLQTLLDMNDIPVGTYNSVTVTLGAGTIGYLNQAPGQPPTIATEAATFTTSSVTVPLTAPLIITQAGAPAGLHFDFDLHKSIQVDGSGNITGTVNPTFDINAVANTDGGAYIDEFDAAVVSVSSQSFMVQGPHGRQFTVNVNGLTQWEGGDTLASLNTSSIVSIAGTLDRADATINADDIAILSQSGFYAGGQVTYVNPASGPSTSFDLYVRGLLPTTTGLQLGQIATIDLTGNEKYFIAWRHNPLSEFLFNQSSLLAGQHISVGGPATGAANAGAVSVKRVVLRHWGFNGTVVPGSVNLNNRTFEMQITGFAGLLVPQTVTVYAGNNGEFRDGLGDMASITDNMNIRVVGLLIKDPLNPGGTALLARYMDDLK